MVSTSRYKAILRQWQIFFNDKWLEMSISSTLVHSYNLYCKNHVFILWNGFEFSSPKTIISNVNRIALLVQCAWHVQMYTFWIFILSSSCNECINVQSIWQFQCSIKSYIKAWNQLRMASVLVYHSNLIIIIKKSIEIHNVQSCK